MCLATLFQACHRRSILEILLLPAPNSIKNISKTCPRVKRGHVFEHNVQILSKSSSGDVHIEAKVPLVWGDKNPSALGAPHGPVKLERPRTRHRERANSVVENREHSENRCPPR